MSETNILSYANLSLPTLQEEWLLYITPRFLTYKPKVVIEIKTPNYTLSTATTISELISLFRMRNKIFLNQDAGLDCDDMDSICDHLVIKSNVDGEICGTYRMVSNLVTQKFYSQGEFNLDEFLISDGVKLELGRACIDSKHRNGAVIDLLWKGIGEYAKRTNAKYLFGCSSVMTVSGALSDALFNSLKRNQQVSETFNIGPVGKYKIDFSKVRSSNVFDEKFLTSQVPSLLRSYLNAGAKVYGPPALDIDFQCIDFFTILNLEELNPSYKRRYF